MQLLILFCLQTHLMSHFIFFEFKWWFSFIHISMATTYTFVKVLIFTFSYHFFCIPGTHKIHGARWLLILCLMFNVHFHRKKNSLSSFKDTGFQKCSSEDFLICFSRSKIIQTSFGSTSIVLAVQEIIFGSPLTQSS